jgi:hypothetical protein
MTPYTDFMPVTFNVMVRKSVVTTVGLCFWSGERIKVSSGFVCDSSKSERV